MRHIRHKRADRMQRRIIGLKADHTELAALQPAEETDGNNEPAADSAEEPQSEPDSANGENAG